MIQWGKLAGLVISLLAAVESAAATEPAGRVELGASAAEADVTVACMYPMTGRPASYSGGFGGAGTAAPCPKA